MNKNLIHYLGRIKRKKLLGFPLWAVLIIGLIILMIVFAFIKDFADSRSLPNSSDTDSSQYNFASTGPSSSSTPMPSSTTSGKATSKPSATATAKASATPTPSPSPTTAPTAQPTASPAPTASPLPKPKCTGSSIAPTSGPAPHTVFLHGSGESQGNSGLVGYQWDYDGNGSWDSDVKIDEIQHTYSTAGQYTPKYRILGSNDQWSDICNYPFTITVTAN